MVVRLATVSGVLSEGRVLLVMPWVPPVRGWWGGQGNSAVGRDGGFLCVGEAGDAVHSVVLGLCGQCRVSLVRLLARVCWRRWFVCLSACGVGAGVRRLPVRVVMVVGVGALGAWSA